MYIHASQMTYASHIHLTLVGIRITNTWWRGSRAAQGADAARTNALEFNNTQ